MAGIADIPPWDTSPYQTQVYGLDSDEIVCLLAYPGGVDSNPDSSLESDSKYWIRIKPSKNNPDPTQKI